MPTSSPRLWLRATHAWRRRAARWFSRRPFPLVPGRAIVSFTFDDFPRSAFLFGGAILEQFNLAGTYYTSLGLVNRTTECGEMFAPRDLPVLVAGGHELGCHTFEHCPASETPPATFEASVRRNAARLADFVPGTAFRTLSYPISYPRPETKHRVAKYFTCCRGGGQTFNQSTIDLNYVSAFFLEQTRGDLKSVEDILLANRAAGGWLVFATHDVTDHPTRFGITPDFFRAVVQLTVEVGAEVLPMARACDVLHARANLKS